MKFGYEDAFQRCPAPATGPCFNHDGEAPLQRADSIEAGPSRGRCWKNEGHACAAIYPAGSAGPKEADELMTRDGSPLALAHQSQGIRR